MVKRIYNIFVIFIIITLNKTVPFNRIADLSKNLLDKNKIITKQHFPDNFELLKEKTCFPYEWINKDNIFDKELPTIDKFYSSLKLQNITKEEYNKTINIYKKLGCKNVKDYLEIDMKLDITLQADIFNTYGNTIWNKFEIDCSKYITSCSLSLDLMLKYTKVKIESFKDITMFDYVDSSILHLKILQIMITINQLFQVVMFVHYTHIL